MRYLFLAALLALLTFSAPAQAHIRYVGPQHDTSVDCRQAFVPSDYKRYATKVYKRKKVSKAAHRRMDEMHICQKTFDHRKIVAKIHRRLLKAREIAQAIAARPVITALMSCIISHESGGDTQATNGQYKGIAQWSAEAWARHGGLKYAQDPRNATYWQQVEILANGLRLYGCRDWCPFDGCG